ncbi:transcription antitermination factor NusB [Ruania albidiflava]|uniref:transcription antitermination factor NusB n=1 Tax=Ruania albidiflava TaxID=366586 RepID=UPI0003B63E41|nr:transcription antitermination factor NusB [Ruania albidiflava]
MPARSRARKRAVDILYEADQRSGASTADDRPVTPASVLAERLLHPGAQTAVPGYAVEIVEGVVAHTERIDEVLATFSQGWTLDRMPAVDRAILRMGAWEVLYNHDVDDAVAIDEAVTLAKELSTDSSPDFVNGLLGRISDLGSALVE